MFFLDLLFLVNSNIAALLQFSHVKKRLPKYEHSDYIINLMIFFPSVASVLLISMFLVPCTKKPRKAKWVFQDTCRREGLETLVLSKHRMQSSDDIQGIFWLLSSQRG